MGFSWWLIYHKKVAVIFLLFLFPMMVWGQQQNYDTDAASFVHSADSLRSVARYNSSNILYQRAAERYDEQEKWLKEAEVLYKISLNKTTQGQFDEATDHLERASSLLQSRKIEDIGLEIKLHHQKAVIAERQANYESALKLAEKGLELANTSTEHIPQRVNLLHAIGDVYIEQGNTQKAIDQFAQAVNLYNRTSVDDERLLSKIYNSYGRAHRHAGNMNQALKHFRESLEIDREILPSHHPDLSRKQNNIAISYYYQGDYKRALDYFINAVNVLAEFYGEEHSQVAAGYNNVGVVYSEMGELGKATEYLEKSLEIKEAFLGTNHPDVAIGYQNLGAIYYDMQEYDHAIDYYKEAEARHLRQFPEGHPELANVYANLGEAYAAKEEYEQALKYYQKDLNINLESSDGKHPFIGDTHTKIGDTYYQIENYEMALNQYQKALDIFFGGYYMENGYENMPYEQVSYPYLLLETLTSKGKTLLKFSKETSREELLKRSLQIHLQAVELIDHLQYTYSREESKFLLRERTVDIYKRGFKTAYLLQEQTADPQYKEYAFYFAEKSRNQILLEQVRRINARDLAQIPDSLINKEQSLQTQINSLQAELSSLAEMPQDGDSLQRAVLQDSLFHLRQRLDKHIRHLDSAHPKYYELKYAPVVTSAETVQQSLLADDQVMVSYFFGEESLFAFIISKNSFEIRDLNVDSVLQQDIKDFRNIILETNSPAGFAEISHQLYNKLIHPIADLINGKDLLIIPDGALHYLPFESLVLDKVTEPRSVRFHNLSYLLLDHTIHYAPSAGFLELSSSAANFEYKKQLAGFAPDFSGVTTSEKRELYPDYKPSLSALPLSKKEIEDLEDLFNDNGGIWSFLKSNKNQADVFIGDTASESTLKNLSLNNYRYIHLATHAFVSENEPERSGILFSATDSNGQDGTLYANEIYNLQLNAHLVTLSACKTGFGTIAEGEGMMSLSRAFQYAGARNLLVSLWNVSDRSTARLMVDFYKQNQEQPMSIALRTVKRNMINNGLYSHPKYWAPFIMIGGAQ